VDREYYFILFYSLLLAFAVFSFAHDTPGRSLFWSMLLALGAFWGTFLLSLVVAHQRERVLPRYYLRLRRLARKVKRKVWPSRTRQGFRQTPL